MESRNLICTICNRMEASFYCTCTLNGNSGQATLLCADHYGEHLIKNPKRMHQILPIQSFSEQITPGYSDRLKDRQDCIAVGTEELKNNLALVDKCIAEFQEKIQDMMTLLSEYRQRKSEELFALRTEIENYINEVLREVENTMYKDDPQMQFPLTRQIREFLKGSRVIKLFDYRIDESPYPSSLEDVLEITVHLSAVPNTNLPIISDGGIQQYDLKTKILGPMLSSPNVSFGPDMVFCQIRENELLGVGANHSVLSVNLKSNEVMILQDTLKHRNCSGVVKYGGFVYVFGGKGEKSAEKYSLSRNVWTSLPDMNRERSAFIPSLYGKSIYLLDSGETAVAQGNKTCKSCRKSTVLQLPVPPPQMLQRIPVPKFGPPSGPPKFGASGGPPKFGYGPPKFGPPAVSPPQKIESPVDIPQFGPSSDILICELFNLETEQLQTLNVKLTVQPAVSLSFIYKEECFIVTSANQMYRWRINSVMTDFELSGFTTQLINEPQQALERIAVDIDPPNAEAFSKLTSFPPVSFEGKLYWYNEITKELNIFEPEFNRITLSALA